MVTYTGLCNLAAVKIRLIDVNDHIKKLKTITPSSCCKLLHLDKDAGKLFQNRSSVPGVYLCT